MIIRADAIKKTEKISLTNKITVVRDGVRLEDLEPVERECTSIECWYDPHLKLWTLYPVDAEGNQLDGATYAHGRQDALKTKNQMTDELIGKIY